MNLLLNRPLRYLITRGDATDLNYPQKKEGTIEIVRRAVDAGIEMIQLREKQLSSGRICDLAMAAVEETSGSETKVLVNDRFDIAVACGAHGVHLTALSMRTEVVRQNVPAGFLIGRSIHGLDEALVEQRSGVDFVVFGPVFYTPDKGSPKGLEHLREVCDAAGKLPVIAIGGIDEQNCASTLESGARGYAAIRYLNDFVMMSQ